MHILLCVVGQSDENAVQCIAVHRSASNGMEWNGMEWNGMEWNGMEWNGIEWNRIVCVLLRSRMKVQTGGESREP
jgi:hypothetical protein